MKKFFKITKPQQQWADITLKGRYIISEPLKNFYETQQTDCNGNPSIVWQQHMEKKHKVLATKNCIIH